MIFRPDPLADPKPLIRRVYAYAAYRLGDGPDAEDVTGETFARALKARTTYDPRKGEPAAWLVGIARRCIADLARPATEGGLVEAASPLDLEDEVVQRLTLAEAVGSLDERSRELIALRYGADLTARQIARLVGMRTNAVEVALHRALARLRERLGAEETPQPVEETALRPALHAVRI
jgi:RNA polymerase sigma-70 factor, ECF subfamily